MRTVHHPSSALLTAAIVLAAMFGAVPEARSDPAASGPPASMFKSGYNKCRLASLTAISKAAGHTYTQAKFDGKACTWSSSDGNYVIVLDTHPSGYLDLMVPKVGKDPSGEIVKAISVPKASKAVVDIHPFKNTRRYQKDLFAAYSQGVVQVSMDNATALRDSALVAVTRLVTRT